MSKTCCLCHIVTSGGVAFSYCSACQSVMYCSKICQKKDWKAHKKICKSLNAGDGAMQVRSVLHEKASAKTEEIFREQEHRLDEDGKRLFKLFTESTFEGSKAAARKMKKIINRLTKQKRKALSTTSLYLLVHANSEKLLWPSSPLLVLLQFFDPNMLTEARGTLLHLLAYLADPSDYLTHENQVILGRQLIEHGANVNAVCYPLHVTLQRRPTLTLFSSSWKMVRIRILGIAWE
jgi:hypothetical protein